METCSWLLLCLCSSPPQGFSLCYPMGDWKIGLGMRRAVLEKVTVFINKSQLNPLTLVHP